MDSPFIGSVVLFAGNYAPRGWAFCQGQLLSIAQNTALFSILGTTYGGNGQTTFALPDLRGRVPVGQGAGPGLSPISLGEMYGTQTVQLTTQQMPQHNHFVQVAGGNADTATSTNNFLATANANYGGDPVTINTYNGVQSSTLNPASISFTGNSLPHDNNQPSLGLNYIIALEGIFPARN